MLLVSDQSGLGGIVFKPELAEADLDKLVQLLGDYDLVTLVAPRKCPFPFRWGPFSESASSSIPKP